MDVARHNRDVDQGFTEGAIYRTERLRALLSENPTQRPAAEDYLGPRVGYRHDPLNWHLLPATRTSALKRPHFS